MVPERQPSLFNKILITLKLREDPNGELSLECNEESKNKICNTCFKKIDRCPMCFCGMNRSKNIISCNKIPQESKINKNNQTEASLTDQQLLAMGFSFAEIQYNRAQQKNNYWIIKTPHFKLEIHKKRGIFFSTLFLISIIGLGYFYKKCSRKKKDI